MRHSVILLTARFIAAALCCFTATRAAHAQGDLPSVNFYTPKPVPLDKDQQAIVEQSLDTITARLKALKKSHPELAHIGEAPWFMRGQGWLRYDYEVDGDPSENAVATVRPGGCGIYLVFTPENSPEPKMLIHYRGMSSGDTNAGIACNYVVASGTAEPFPNQGGLEDDVCKTISSALGDSLDQLGSEYLLKKRNVNDTAAIIDLLADDDWRIRDAATTVLATRQLTPAQFEKLKAGYLSGAYPLTRNFETALLMVQKQDPKNLPAFALAIAKITLQAERAGKDVLHPSLIINVPWNSDMRSARAALIGVAGNDPGMAPVAGLIMNEDPSAMNRQIALDYLAKLPEKERHPWLAAALGNSYHSIQAAAAEKAGSLKTAGVEKELTALLVSPSAKVRQAASAAVAKLSLYGIAPNPPRPLPASVKKIADALWSHGLTEEDVVTASAKPDENSAAFNDPWRMMKMDPASVRKRAAQYAAGVREASMGRFIDRTGPFLLAAAMKLGDTATAQSLYETLSDNSECDDQIIYTGIEGIAEPRFISTLKLYHAGKDDEALVAAAPILALEKLAIPNTYLDSYVTQMRAIQAEIARRKTDGAALPPILNLVNFHDPRTYEQYWSRKIPDKIPRIKTLIAQLENDGATNPDFTTDYMGDGPVVEALVVEGDDAIEPLLDCLVHDRRLTRSIDEDDHGAPLATVIPVRRAAFAALERMASDKYTTLAARVREVDNANPKALEKIANEEREILASREQD